MLYHRYAMDVQPCKISMCNCIARLEEECENENVQFLLVNQLPSDSKRGKSS